MTDSTQKDRKGRLVFLIACFWGRFFGVVIAFLANFFGVVIAFLARFFGVIIPAKCYGQPIGHSYSYMILNAIWALLGTIGYRHYDYNYNRGAIE